ncbi:hypothetical protein QQS21_000569 [Conoideocrella luteorostrata]|uniref:BZIP domain-containing protein n=1 Tax=Conoideocrella luteorostrata TaxID=1105319 RepID=A0AAJ0D0W1_9HYPO|nr:hypothetical protein QQS21_000569 [Conoideocrella luteorostrata]
MSTAAAFSLNIAGEIDGCAKGFLLGQTAGIPESDDYASGLPFIGSTEIEERSFGFHAGAFVDYADETTTKYCSCYGYSPPNFQSTFDDFTALDTAEDENITLSPLSSQDVAREPSQADSKFPFAEQKFPSESFHAPPPSSRFEPKPREKTNGKKKEEELSYNKHQQCIEENRVAASRFRKRKKDWVEKIEQRESEVKALNGELQAQYMSLLQEISVLKSRILCHAGCHDPIIDVWINFEASKYARRLSSESETLSSQEGTLRYRLTITQLCTYLLLLG